MADSPGGTLAVGLRHARFPLPSGGATYRIAGIDVHKKMLAVIADVAAEGEYHFERRRFGSGPQELRTCRDG